MSTINTSGKRKRAIARITLRKGNGIVTINGVRIENFEPAMYRMRIQEPLILSGVKDVDIMINVVGGGIASQAGAARLAIARALVEQDSKLKAVFIEYDRQLLVADIRRKESAKPNSHGHARSKRQKSYR
ncbi:MAG: 30S ribosomal protein S9 [Nanoarchaeota archaeon]